MGAISEEFSEIFVGVVVWSCGLSCVGDFRPGEFSKVHSQTFRRLSVEGRPVIRRWTWDSRGGSTLIKRCAFSHV